MVDPLHWWDERNRWSGRLDVVQRRAVCDLARALIEVHRDDLTLEERRAAYSWLDSMHDVMRQWGLQPAYRIARLARRIARRYGENVKG